MARIKQDRIRRKLEARMARTLDAASREPEDILNVQDGLLFECALCDTKDKSCIHDPRRWCRRVYKGGTLLEECERLIRATESNDVVSCLNCGRRISAAHLAKEPCAVFCADCQITIGRVLRSRAKGVRR